MDFWDSLTVMMRRWYITLPVAVLCAIATFSFSNMVDPEYLANGTVFVKGPEVQEVLEDGVPTIVPRNPYLGTGGTDTFARILVESVSSESTRQDFFARGYEPLYRMSLDRSEPIIRIQVSANDPALAVDTVAEVLAVLGSEAETRQLGVDGLDESALIVIEPLSQSTASTDNTVPRRVFGALAAASLIITVGAAFLVEGVFRHRRGDWESWVVESEQVEATIPRKVESIVAAEDDRRTDRGGDVSVINESGRGTAARGDDDDDSEDAGPRSRWHRRAEGQ